MFHSVAKNALKSSNYLSNIIKNGSFRYKSSCGITCDGNKSHNLLDPACKVALIIGGCSGIGYQIASALLREGAKAVAITGVESCKGKDSVNLLNNAYGRGKAMFINSNNNCTIQLEETFKVVKKTHKHLDIVVNSAGIIDGKYWEKEIVTNLVGTIRTTLLAQQYMGKEGGRPGLGGTGGTVLNISGVYGLEPLAPAPTFTATQHAVLGLSKAFGDKSHVTRSGVRVVCLCPGATNTHFFRGVEDRGMSANMGTELKEMFKCAKKQKAEVVGQAAIQVLRCGKSGSVWVVEGSRLFLLDIPMWEKHATLKSQFM